MFGFQPISSTAGLLSVLLCICAFFFFLQQATRWRLFHFVPPLIFIYALPMLLSNSGALVDSVRPLFSSASGAETTPTPSLIVNQSPVYDTIRELVLPLMLVLLLLNVDVAAAVRVMGRGVLVMLMGTLGVVVGAPIAYLLVKQWLAPDGWQAFGILAGSWIGGTANMAAAADSIGADDNGTQFGLAVLGDTTIYIVWLPILLMSKHLAGHFGRFTKISADRLARMEEAAKKITKHEVPLRFQHVLYLAAIALAVTWVADLISSSLPEYEPYVEAGSWRILCITTIAIGLSMTRLKRIPGSHELAMAFVYLFVARMGAIANLSGVAEQALPFLAGAFVWIFIHGAFCLLAAKLLRVDVHTAAIASAANIGGAASTPIVAAYHNEKLVPAGILLAMIGYAVGNYAAYIAGRLCQWISMIGT